MGPTDHLLLQGLPKAMTEKPQWLLWRFITYEGDKKPRKVPFYVSGRKRSGSQGSQEDRDELKHFETALGELARGKYDGLGFAFLPGDGLIGIDIDDVVDEGTGEVSERCQAIVAACASYTEWSPSKRGVHIIVEGQTKTFKDNSIGLEVFCGAQFFTCTGDRWPDLPDQVVPIAEGTISRLRKTVEVAKKKAKQPKPPPVQTSAPPSDGVTDFDRVNEAALARLDAWVPTMFSTAKFYPSTGAWRVTSKDLGRNLQEDLSLAPNGIVDFGTDKGMTPIDVVVEWSRVKPRDALTWLAQMVGVTLTPLKPSGKKAKGSARAQPSEGQSTPPRGSAEGEEGSHWRERLLRTSEGGKKDCRENVFTMLSEHPKLKGLVAFDEFSYRVMKQRDPPWVTTPGEWTTNDDYELGLWLAQTEKLVIKAEATLAAGVGMAAFRAKYHPVRRYLQAQTWDNTPRLLYWLHECLGAADTIYHQLVGKWFILGMVNRVLNPGCQMDNMIVLEGGQGKGKSTALRVLAGEWFADTPIKIGDKDALLNLAGVWLYEVAELDAFNKAEVTAVKQYVSSRVDRVREPFARRPIDRPRSCVLGGTTNQHEYFKDSTGSRRFWPVLVADEIMLERLAEWRDQLFAEAVHLLAQGERYHPSRDEIKTYIEPEQESREIADPWFEKVAVWVDLPAQMHRKKLTSSEILGEALGVAADRIDGARGMATRVGVVMRKLGWGKQRDDKGARLWRYVRPTRSDPITGGDSAGGPAGPVDSNEGAA